MESTNNDLYVLVVDDTVVYRRILQNVVAEIPNAKVVGVAANGRIALDRLEQLEVDVVLLDVEMPELDGIETLKEVRARWPGIGVVLLSGSDRRSADLTMRALELGALDFVSKADTGDIQRNHRQLVGQLGAIFRSFQIRRQLQYGQPSRPPAHSTGIAVGARLSTKMPSVKVPERDLRSGATSDQRVENKASSSSGAFNRQTGNGIASPLTGDSSRKGPIASARPNWGGADVLLIGCSTGGPQALAKIVPSLPANLGIPVLVVQHMPAVFTASLAESLNRSSAMRVCEAAEGNVIVPNVVYIAPGGRHMTVACDRSKVERRIALNDDPLVNSCRPSVDVLFRSAVAAYGGGTLSVILTGMGEDGLDGVRALRAVGGRTLSQTEDSCVVYGMPRAIDLAGCSDENVALDSMTSRIIAWLRAVPARSALTT